MRKIYPLKNVVTSLKNLADFGQIDALIEFIKGKSHDYILSHCKKIKDFDCVVKILQYAMFHIPRIEKTLKKYQSYIDGLIRTSLEYGEVLAFSILNYFRYYKDTDSRCAYEAAVLDRFYEKSPTKIVKRLLIIDNSINSLTVEHLYKALLHDKRKKDLIRLASSSLWLIVEHLILEGLYRITPIMTLHKLFSNGYLVGKIGFIYVVIEWIAKYHRDIDELEGKLLLLYLAISNSIKYLQPHISELNTTLSLFLSGLNRGKLDPVKLNCIIIVEIEKYVGIKLFTPEIATQIKEPMNDSICATLRDSINTAQKKMDDIMNTVSTLTGEINTSPKVIMLDCQCTCGKKNCDKTIFN